MKKSINLRKMFVLALVIYLTFTINISSFASSNTVSKEFMSQLKNDTTLGAFENEDDVIDYIKRKGQNASIGQGGVDEAIKQYYKNKTDIAKIAETKDKEKKELKDTLANEILQKKNEHMAKINKVEAEIQKHVSYNTKSNYEKNIEFLLDNKNTIGLNEELIVYYIAGYCHHVRNINTKKILEKYLNITPETFNNNSNKVVSSLSKLFTPNTAYADSWDGYAARTYAHNYCGTYLNQVDSTGYNTSNYPVYSSISNPNNDCANFGSQCLQAGGKQEFGSNYKRADHWFCNTTSSTQLTLCSLTWRYCPSLKLYWKTRCSSYKEVKERDAYYYNDFINNVYEFLYYGDIIHLADSGGAPYHTLITTSYYVDGLTDIGYSCHTANQKDKSLYYYTSLSDDLLLLYHFN